jgi:hypothetical protein
MVAGWLYRSSAAAPDPLEESEPDGNVDGATEPAVDELGAGQAQRSPSGVVSVLGWPTVA